MKGAGRAAAPFSFSGSCARYCTGAGGLVRAPRAAAAAPSSSSRDADAPKAANCGRTRLVGSCGSCAPGPGVLASRHCRRSDLSNMAGEAPLARDAVSVSVRNASPVLPTGCLYAVYRSPHSKAGAASQMCSSRKAVQQRTRRLPMCESITRAPCISPGGSRAQARTRCSGVCAAGHPPGGGGLTSESCCLAASCRAEACLRCAAWCCGMCVPM
jgi:hypothetical protein